MYSEILRYMGYEGEADEQIMKTISLCLEKLSIVSTPRHVVKQFPCTVTNDTVTINTVKIKSVDLASHLSNCESAYVFSATLGASVDRLIAQCSLLDSSEALCCQACAATQIEDYCDNIEKEIMCSAKKDGFSISTRFSPGYGDFDIAYQSDILRLLNAQKEAGITETRTHMLSPLKSVTAVIGIISNAENTESAEGRRVFINKCVNCGKTDCEFRITKGKAID